MLTPISTASTAAGPDAAHQRQQHQHCGQVVDDVRQHCGDGGDAQQREQCVAAGSTPRMADSRPWSMSPSTTTPRHSTNTRNGTSAASTMPPTDVSPPGQCAHAEHDRTGQRRPRRREPEHRGDREADQRQREHHEHEHRNPRPSRCPARGGVPLRGRARKANAAIRIRRRPRASHGGAITAVKWTKRQARGA